MEQSGATSDDLKIEFEELLPDQLSSNRELADIFPDLTDETLNDTVLDHRNKNDLELLDHSSNAMEQLGATSVVTLRAETRQELRIVLIGKSGSGKSSTGNTILGEELFKTCFSASSVTQTCQEVLGVSSGQAIKLIDTPGIFDSDRPNAQVLQEIARCISMSLPGPHVFLLVLQAGRFTPEENDTVNHFAEMFGEDVFEHMILVFTGRDTLEKHKQTFDEFLQTIPPSLARIREKCNNRCVAVDNSPGNTSRSIDGRKLIDEINVLVERHHGKYYTNEMFKAAEKKCREREEEIRRQKDQEKEEEKQKMKDQLNKEFQKKIHDLELERDSYKQEISDRERRKEMLEKKMQDCNKKEEIAAMKEKIRSIEKETEQLQQQVKDAEQKWQDVSKEWKKNMVDQMMKIDRHYKEVTDALNTRSKPATVLKVIKGILEFGLILGGYLSK